MKSLMTFVGILAFNLPNIAVASDFSCPVSANVSNFTCSGTVKVKTLAELNAYVNNLGVVAKKPTIAKNLQIDFNPALTSDLVISTPCSIKVPTDIVMTSTANICLHGAKGVSIDENFKFTGKNLKLESKEEVIINKNSVIKAQDIKLLSIGAGDSSKTYIREAANIEAANLSIESFDKGFIGKNSIVKLTGALGIYSLGDDEASVREGARVEAAKIEISSTEETRIAKLTTLVATEIILNGVKCTINKTAVITATDRMGNCFLTSTTNKAKFSINKNQGTNPLTVNFNASTITDAKGFIWSFGDGETLNSLTPNVTHVYNRVGSFTATLKYATKDNYKGLKSAGAIQIDVKEAPISNPVIPVPPRGDLKYQTDGTFVYLRGFIRKGTYDIANAYYIIDDNQNNKIQIPNFYQNSLISVEMHTYARHKVTMHVIDVQGLSHTKSMNIYTDEYESDVYPYIRLDVDQSAARTMLFDMSWSFNPVVGETLKNFTIDFGDGQTAVLTDTAFITHTYAQAGTYVVRGTGQANGNEDYDEFEIQVTNENTPIMNPVAGFEYHIYDYAGNVMFTDDRSGTPNGEIISYVWDFGDGTVGYGKNASNFYAPGEYLVTLTVVDTAGMRSSQIQKITIAEEGDDIASMLDCWSDGSKHLGCEVVAFDKFNEITRVKLDWGDGISENLTVPDFMSTGFSIREHSYQNYGTYNVILTIDTTRGQTKNLSYSITYTEVIPPVDPVYYPPIADIQCTTNNALVTCNALGSYDPQGKILEYNFSFSSDVKISNNNGLATHVYTTPGMYLVSVNVRNIYGQSSNAEAWVQVYKVNNALPTANVVCYSSRPYTIICDPHADDIDGAPVMASYEVDGKQIDQAPDTLFSYTFSQSGEQSLKLTITDNDGGRSEYVKSVIVLDNNPPVVSFSCYSDLPFKVNCISNSYDTDLSDQIIDYEWEFGDNDLQKGLIPNVTKTLIPGIHTVKLTVFDQYGEKNSKTIQVSVKENTAPYVNIICNQLDWDRYKCTSSVQDPDLDGFIVSKKWTLSDGKIIDGSEFVSKFSTEEEINISFEVIDNLGAKASAVFKLSLEHNSPATFDVYSDIDSGNVPLVVNFRAYNVKDANGVQKVQWVLPDGSIIEQASLPSGEEYSIAHTFNEYGNHIVKFRVIDESSKITEKDISISAGTNSQVVIDSNRIGFFANENILFFASFEDNNNDQLISYTWLVDGDVVSINQNLNYTFDDIGLHQIELRAVTQLGLKMQAVKNLIVDSSSNLFLSGKINSTISYGSNYKVQLEKHFSNIILPNELSVELLNAPAGMTYDSQKDVLSWVPGPNQIGTHEFKIKLTSDLYHHIRQAKVVVNIPKVIGSYNVSPENKSFYISKQDSALNNTSVIYEGINDSFNVKVIENEKESGSEIILQADSGEIINDKFRLAFHSKGAQVQMTGTEVSALSVSDITSIAPINLAFNVDAFFACPNIPFFIRKKDSAFKGATSQLPFKKYGTISIWLSKKIQEEYSRGHVDIKKYLDSVDSTHQLSINARDLNVTFMHQEEDSHLKPNLIRTKPRDAYHIPGDMSSVVINIDSLMKKPYIETQLAVLHEYYHVLQARALNCRKIDKPSYTQLNVKPLIYDVMNESSADYYALANVKTNDEQFLEMYFDSYKDKWAFTTENLYNNTFRKGAFNFGRNAEKYIPFYMWMETENNNENSKLDYLDFLKYLDDQAPYSKLITEEYLDDTYMKTIFDKYISLNYKKYQKIFSNINELFYFAPDTIVPSLEMHFTRYLDSSKFPFSDYDFQSYSYVGSETDFKAKINVSEYGGEFFRYNPSSTSRTLAYFPTFVSVKVKKTTGVKSVLTQFRSYSPAPMIRNGENDGEYRFLFFSLDGENVFSEYNNSDFVLSFANASGSKDEAVITKKVLCRTKDLPLFDTQENMSSVIRINCGGKDCREIKQLNYACSKDTVPLRCNRLKGYSNADYSEKIFPVSTGNYIVSCQHGVSSSKEYITDSDLDFTQSTMYNVPTSSLSTNYLGY